MTFQDFASLPFSNQLDALFDFGEHVLRLDEFQDLYYMDSCWVISLRNNDREIIKLKVFQEVKETNIRNN